MTGLNIIIVALVVTVLNAVCFMLGVCAGFRVADRETGTSYTKLPTQDTERVRKTKKEKQQERFEAEHAQKEQEQFEVILRNIEAYDGTGLGQRDIPRR